ncbi:MAG TPA: DNA polymerase III subunit gamma/tau [Nitrospinaceae bacterium]|jgi:DNA polymerase-3 subunit gamma/tau|nr:DNA polymerase III subunit gamma/tau [Nitrospinaceae bacterium]HIL27213.1 DNA polymerase III subunit gamma/tau [Nitrospinaceae bacterium]
MDFQVSARKWRPQKFSELIGQEHIVRTLRNAIELDKLAHAYLFSGTRGVGKTTTARILAKAINCAKGPIAEPCDECDFCQEIKLGNSIDVREIDGASNNSVAEARELIETIQYAASSSRYKVYIIDEVHMLSKSAFNALLKTLEEPPPKVVFLFATTELSKIPETILSRCQCFEFKPLSQRQIIEQLKIICNQEGIEVNGLGLEKIAKSGAGSMRDAQSLLDQVIAYCGNKIENDSVEEVLGVVGRTTLEKLVGHLIKKDSGQLLETVQSIVADGKDLNFLCRDLAEYMRNLMMVKLSKTPDVLLDTHACNLQVLQAQSKDFHVDELQQMFSVLSRTEMEMKRSSLAQMIFEMSILRLAEIRPFNSIDDMIKAINSLEEVTEPVVTANASINSIKDELKINEPAKLSSSREIDSVSSWEQIKQEICARKPVFKHYLEQCKILEFSESNLKLGFIDAITLDQVKNQENLQLVKDAVKLICEREINVTLVLSEKSVIKDSHLSSSRSEIKEKKKSFDQSQDKSEAEIIQYALDVFRGVVIK